MLIVRQEKGAILLGVMLVIILIGITLIGANMFEPTKRMKQREGELEFKLSELRKALGDAMTFENSITGECRTVSAMIYGPAKLSYDVETGETILTANMITKYGFGPLKIQSEASSEVVVNYLIHVLKEEGYLRSDYTVPMLEGYRFVREDGSVDEQVKVGWRISQNMLTSSSFEQDILEKPMLIEHLLETNDVNEYWFTLTENYSNLHVTTTMEPPPYDDYEGQRTTQGRKGKFGRKVMILKLPEN